METLADVFMWCFIINGGLLILYFIMMAVAKDWIYRKHTMFFKDLTKERFDAIHYFMMGLFKTLVIMGNLVPFIALRIVIGCAECKDGHDVKPAPPEPPVIEAPAP